MEWASPSVVRYQVTGASLPGNSANSTWKHLADWARQPEVTFVVDTMPLGNWAILVSFGILSHSRVWPLGWRVMPGEHSWQERQYDLIGDSSSSSESASGTSAVPVVGRWWIKPGEAGAGV